MLTLECTAAVHVVDFYLDDEREKERAHILELITKRTSSSDELLQGYVREATRKSSLFKNIIFSL